LIPIDDDNPTLRTPIVTYVIVALIIASWIFLQGAGFNQMSLVASVCNLGLVPGEITRLARLGEGIPIAPGVACVVDNEPINILTPITSMFLHGGWGHLIGNLVFFWVFGNNVEDSMGRIRFLLFYLICGLAAAVAHILVQPASPLPTVGASGAISGVLGAYLVLYPKIRINMLFIFVIFWKVIAIPAWVVLIFWFLWQLFAGIPELLAVRPDVSSGVAVWAHIGGFVAGFVLVKIFENPMLVARRAIPGER
jgi:membrane associated rhomboid family serine protease